MNVRRLLVALWLVGAFALGVGAWRLPEHRFVLGVVSALFVVAAIWVARTDVNGDGGDPW